VLDGSYRHCSHCCIDRTQPLRYVTPPIDSVLTRRAKQVRRAQIENDFQKKCRKGAKFAAHTAFSARLGEISCLFWLALEFSTPLSRRFLASSGEPGSFELVETPPRLKRLLRKKVGTETTPRPITAAAMPLIR
jgi:hypothetical protein